MLMQIFWDMENCTLNDEWPCRAVNDDVLPHIGGPRLTAHQHYNLLLNFAMQLGVAKQDLLLHAGISMETLIKHTPNSVRNNIRKVHSPYVQPQNALGNNERLRKKEAYVVDFDLLRAMERYLECAARPGDILMLISGAKASVGRHVLPSPLEFFHVQAQRAARLPNSQMGKWCWRLDELIGCSTHHAADCHMVECRRWRLPADGPQGGL